MKQLWLHFVLAGWALLGLESCNSGSQAGGPASETTNGIMASVLTDDGIPAFFANAALRKADFVSSDTSGNLFATNFNADSKGNLKIPRMDPGTYRLTISDNNGTGVYSREIFVSNETLDLGQIQLEKPGTISGKFSDENGEIKAQWIGVYGLDILTRTDSNGNFTLRGLPSGTINLYVLKEILQPVIADTSITIKSNESNFWIHTIASYDTTKQQDSAQKDTSVWMLFENFDDSTAFVTKAWYYTATSDTSVDISYSVGDAWNFVKWDSTRNSNVFSGSNPMFTSGYVLLGTQISSTGIDLSALDSVCFYAKGSGYIRFALERWKSGATDNLKAWTDNISLTSDWKRYTITPTDFLASTSNFNGWENVKSTVSQIHIFGLSGQEMSLDEITFYGVKF